MPIDGLRPSRAWRTRNSTGGADLDAQSTTGAGLIQDRRASLRVDADGILGADRAATDADDAIPGDALFAGEDRKAVLSARLTQASAQELPPPQVDAVLPVTAHWVYVLITNSSAFAC